MATILGVGDVTGSGTLTITLTADQPAGTVVHLVAAGVTVGTAAADFPQPSALPSDSKTGSWEDTTFAGTSNPIIGAISNNVITAGTHKAVQLGETAIRTSGARLVAGDTVTSTWSVGDPTKLTLAGAVIAFSNMGTVVVEQFLGGTAPGNDVGVEYGNGDTRTSASTLNWVADLGTPSLEPYPKLTCRMFVGSAAYPALSGWTPTTGTKVVEHQSGDGNLSLAVHAAAAEALLPIEPGGSWGSAGAVLVANYQFVAAVGLQSWHKF